MPRRYSFAILMIAIAALARYVLGAYAGLRPPFVVFYPAVLIISGLVRFWPSIAATFLSIGIAEELFISHGGARPADRVQELLPPTAFCILAILSSALLNAARRRAERALRAGEDRYRDLVEHSEDLLCTHDLRGRLLTVNPAPARILGYSVEELLKIPMRNLIIPEGREEFDRYLERLRTTGQPEHGLLCVICKNGELRTWEYHNTLRTEGVNKPIVRGMAHDVTERRRADLALQESEQRERARAEELQTILDTLPIPVVIAHDPQCLSITANFAGYEQYGAPPGSNLSVSAAKDKPPYRFLRGDMELSQDQLPLHIAAATALPVRSVPTTLVLGDGTRKHELGNAAPLLGADGKVRGAVAAAIDVTDLIQAEDALRKSEERFRVALKDSPITVFNQDRELRYSWIYNPQFGTMQDILGKSDDDLLGADSAQPLSELKQKVIETGLGTRKEVVVRQNGKALALDIKIEPLFDAEGKVAGITGASMDVAKLRELADSLEDAKGRLAREKSYLEREIDAALGFEGIIGQSPVLCEALEKARVVAPTDSTVLLLGETGTGKELVARSIHALSARHDNNFIKLNCAAVPTGLLESELFGHEKGAFTGAISQKVGRIELAENGTLLLDEVGELPLELQPKLLRLLQDREFERLGGVRTLRVDVRIIAATNRDLRADVAARKFREDLFYRLDVFPIELPPLRQRRADIRKLVHHFVGKYSARMGKHIEAISNETLSILEKWIWPGNIRELENMIERMVILSKGDVLAPPPIELYSPEIPAEDSLTEMERDHIIRVLREAHGVLSGANGAASRLGIKRTTLQSMMKRFNIQPKDFRNGSETFGPE